MAPAERTSGALRAGVFVAVVGALMLASGGEARAQRVNFEAATSVPGSATQVAFGFPVGSASNRYLVVAVAVTPASAQPNTVTYAGQALTRIGGRGSSTCRSELWGLAAPPSGAAVLHVVFGGGPSGYVVAPSWYSGVDPRDPTGPFASHTGSGDSPQDLSTSVANEANDFTVDVLCGTGSGAPTPAAGSGQTQRWRRSMGNLTGVGSSQQNNSGGRATMSWTLTGSGSIDWSIATFPLKPAPPGPDAAADAPPDVMPDATEPDVAADLAPPDLAEDTTPADLAEPDAEPDRAADLAGDLPPEEDAGPDDVAPATADYHLRVGCACRTGGAEPAGAAMPVLVGALLALVRRRGRGPRRPAALPMNRG
jgi:MYXO-CTERM domain-containing protein